MNKDKLKEILTQVFTRTYAAAKLVLDAFLSTARTIIAALVRLYLASPLSTLVNNVRATSGGRWLEAHLVRITTRIIGLWQQTRTVYKKLTSPPPDPLMAALMMQGQKVDLDEDPTALKGNRLFALIGAFFTIMVIWAIFTELDSAVRAEGSVVPPSSVQLVQNRLPGSIISVRVALGDRVQKNDVMFRLEDEEVNANFDDNEITRLAALARAVRLAAEARGEDALVFPEWLERQDPEVVKAERALFTQRQTAINNRLIVIEQQGRENDLIAKNMKARLEIFAPLVEAGHEPRLTLIDLQSEFDRASLASERLQNEYNATLSSFRAEAARELSDVKTQADQANAREDAFRVKVNNAEVRAPVSGIISAVHIKTEGAVVQAGTVLAEIVPDEPTLLVQARILSEDITSIHIGQKAQVSLAAYDVSRYGSLIGYVKQIAGNTTQEEGIPPYYVTIVEVPNPKFSKSAEEVMVVPGMSGMIDIIGSKRTVMSYIFTPLERASSIAFREQ